MIKSIVSKEINAMIFLTDLIRSKLKCKHCKNGYVMYDEGIRAKCGKCKGRG